MTDDEDRDLDADPETPRERPVSPRPARTRSHWDDDARADWSQEHRKTTPVVQAVPEPTDERAPEDITKPHELYEREYNDAEREVINRLGIDVDRPIPAGQWVKTIVRLDDLKRERRKRDTEQAKRDQERADQILRMQQQISPEHIEKLKRELGDKDAELDRKIETLAAYYKWGKWLGIVLAPLLVANLIGMGRNWLSGHDADIAAGVKLDQLTHIIEKLENRLDALQLALGRHSSITPDISIRADGTALTTTKGSL